MSIRLIIFMLVICAPTIKAVKVKSKSTVVLISFDGFRYDYIDRDNLEHLKEFANEGVRANSLKGTFVTKTFPNHYTMVTGLYEESHGIISNYMYDPVYKEYFTPLTKAWDSKWWNNTTPIWISNELQYKKASGISRKSATIYWPGSGASYLNHRPYFYKRRYDSSFTSKMRFDTIVELLLKPDPVNFIACYFEEPDKSSHRYGPNDGNVTNALRHLDKLFGQFIKKLKRANLYEQVNIIVVSDHGMASVPHQHVITLSDYVDQNDYDLVSYGTFILVRPQPGKKESLYKSIQKIRHLNTYYKEDIPERWHYRNNRRVPEIFAIADEGYFVAPNRSKRLQPFPLGDHGYDNECKNMHGIFLAHGPEFKKKLISDTVMTLDLYSLMCKILDIQPHPNNGSLDRIKHVLAERTLFSEIRRKPMLTVALLSVCGILVLVVVLGCTISCLRSLMQSTENLPKNDDEVPLANWEEEDDSEKSENDFPFKR